MEHDTEEKRFMENMKEPGIIYSNNNNTRKLQQFVPFMYCRFYIKPLGCVKNFQSFNPTN